MWYEHKFFKYSAGLIMILLIIFLLGQVDFFLLPFKNIVSILFFPLLTAGLLYYLFRPAVKLMEKIRIPRTISIIVIYLIIAVLSYLTVSYAGSIITTEFNQLIKDIPEFINVGIDKVTEFVNNTNIEFIRTDDMIQKLTSFVEKTIPVLSQGIFSGISMVASITTVLLLVPLVLFFFLKDEYLFSQRISKIVPRKYKKQGMDIIQDIDKTLSNYIIGQTIIALTAGILMYIGYIILGLKYALILALFAMVTSIIPFLGPIIGIIPALLVGLGYNPFILVKILILTAIVQQLQANLIIPLVVGKRMRIHPLTIILLLLVSAPLYGLIGMIIVIPAYAVAKILAKGIYNIYNSGKSTQY